MSNPYVGEIRIFAGNFAPLGWLFCAGQTLAISENDILFNLIGTTYGGDGQETFNLPDLRSRVPVHNGKGPGVSQTYVLGQMGGVEQVTLTTQQLPMHTHAFLATTDTGTQNGAAGAILASGSAVQALRPAPPNQPFDASAIGPAGGNQPHTNIQPYVAINYIISLYGVFPHQ